jgi:ubiquinone/menaquinone biosynthesis C-methylase UbiE
MLPLGTDFSYYHFCDVGSGTGIALYFVMKNYDFLSYSGFDIDKSLIEIGYNFFLQQKLVLNLTVSDAAKIILKKRSSVYFLFNPFSFNTLE